MAGRDVIFTILCIDEASHALNKVGRKAEETGGKLGAFGRVGAMALVAIAAAAGEIAVKSVELGMKFQSSMAMIHTQARVSQKDVDALSGKVLDLAGAVGVGPESLSDALYHIESSFASTGITGKKAMDILKVAAEGAKIGHADLVDVTNALDAAIASGIPGVQNFSQAMGALNAAVGAGDMHMQDMANAFSTGMVATVKTYGLSLRDVSAALATFGDNNMRGQLAGNQLRMSMQAMVMPIKGAETWLAKLGLTTTSLAQALRHGGMEEALQLLVQHLRDAGVSSKETGDYITHMFGRKAGTGLNILIDQFDRLKSKYKDIDHASQSFGQTWADQQKLLQQQFDQLKAGAEALLTKIGLKLIPILSAGIPMAMKGASDATGWLIENTKGLVQWFRDTLIPAYQRAYGEILPAVQKAIATVSAAFRDHQGMVNGVTAVFKILGAFIVDLVIPAMVAIDKVILSALGPAFRLIGTLVDTVVVPAFKFMMNAFMSVAGVIVDGAAWAFGWIPGIGPKLKSAQAAFHKFRDDVNAALAGITDKDVKVTAHIITVGGEAVQIHDQTGTTFQADAKHRAMGGPVWAGAAYIVGEHGQETFIPSTSGTIIPHGGVGATQVTNVHLHMQSGFVGSAREIGVAFSEALQRAKSQGIPINV